MRSTLAVCVAAAALGLVAPAPNFVFLLADDLESDYKQDRLAFMPHLRALRDAGLLFSNHVAAHPVCGPSRSSFLAGRFPHNTGYKYNADAASMAAWALVQNNTLGTWLTTAGYYTAYHGKYINGMEASIPAGWRHWGGFSSGTGTYNYFNSTPYAVAGSAAGEPLPPFSWSPSWPAHQADVLAAAAAASIAAARAEGRPFYIQLNPVMVHWGMCKGPCPPGEPRCRAGDDPNWEMNLTGTAAGDCPEQPGAGARGCALPSAPCPSARHAHAIDGLTNPRTPAWNASATGGVPAFIERSFPGVSPYEAARQDMGFRNRSASAADLDDLLGSVVAALAAAGALDDTFVFFTSDNGFHLGERKMVFGKGQPYDTDVRLPFYVRGPGVPAGATRAHPTTHVDVTATIVELARAAPVGPPLDGLSFAAALGPAPPAPAAWRNFSFSEYFGGDDTWSAVRFPAGGAPAAAPPALAGRAVKLARWCTNESEVFDLADDEWELRNLAAEPAGAALVNGTLATLAALAHCSGRACNEPARAPPNGAFPCYKIGPIGDLDPFDP